MPRRQLKNSKLNFTHHFVVNRDQQGAGSDPGERAGNADGSVSDHTGKSYGSSNTHNKFYHAGCKWCTSVLHTLDGSTINGKKTEDKVKRCNDSQIHIGIMVNFLCRIGQEHLHDRVAKKQDTNTHDQIKSFCLDQTSPYTLTDPFSFACTEILGNIIGNCSHHSIIYKHRKLIGFGSCCISGNSSSTKRIHNCLHGKLPDAHDRHLKSHRKACFQMQADGSADVMKIFAA